MVDATKIREHMSVIGSDGEHVGTVDAVEGDRIKLTRTDSREGAHHFIPVTQVARVDDHVHLSVPAISAIPGGAGPVAGATGTTSAIESPLPSTLNRAVEGAVPRKNFYLPWIVGAIGLALLFLLFKSCVGDREQAAVAPTVTEQTTATTTDNTVVAETPNAPQANALASVSGLGSYLAGVQPTPHTFQFQRINFDTGASAIRPADQSEIDQVAAVLTQYATSKVRIAGYADARGSDPANAKLGQARADAVKAALVAKGVAANRIETTTGGERDPVDTNATAGGQFENRRTELVVTAR